MQVFQFKYRPEKSVLLVFYLFWLSIGLYACTLGFGADTDAWLLVRTALKLVQGKGYDPARSLGNPAYELALTGLFPLFRLGVIPNMLNLGLAIVFLSRLPRYFPLLSDSLYVGFTIILGIQLWWLECATSTLEFMPAWLLTFEALHRFLKNPHAFLAWGMAAFAVAFRLEFALFFLIAFWPKCTSFRLRIQLALIFICLPALFIMAVWGINPLPFSGISGLFFFYLGRLKVLFFQSGLQAVWIAGSLLIWLTKLFSDCKNDPMSRFAWCNACFFLLFPFEWAYAGPAFLVAQASVWPGLSNRGRYLALLGLGFGLLPVQTGFSSGFLPSIWQDRMEIKLLYIRAQASDPAVPTIWLYGATWLTTHSEQWEEVLPGRMFHKKESKLFVAERLNFHQLDSLAHRGFRLIGHLHYKHDNAFHPKIWWVDSKDLQ